MEVSETVEQNGDVLLSFLNGGKGTHNFSFSLIFPSFFARKSLKRKFSAYKWKFSFVFALI